MAKDERAEKKPAAPPQSEGAAGEDSSDLYENRLRKLRALQDEGRDPYAEAFRPDALAANLLETPEAQFGPAKIYALAGRIRSKRVMGKAGFLDLEDASGRIQLYAGQKDLGEGYAVFSDLDLGDIVGVTGYLFKTKTGQTTIHLQTLTLLAKCLRPLPVVKEADGKVFDAFADKEQRYRMRYVDLVVNPDVRRNFQTRSRLVSAVRAFLTARDFLEVETPMMHTIPGGAAAKPFVTHHNTLDMELYLRIAPELYLKRLLVGGFSRVFEINRNFRNEGVSFKHNPEFTMLELYEAYGDMNSMLAICEELIINAAQATLGTATLSYGAHQIRLDGPWPRLKYLDAVEKYSGAALRPDMPVAEARELAVKAGVRRDDVALLSSVWTIAEAIFDERVEKELIQPTFIVDYPKELSPLAKSYPDRRDVTQRFELYVAGFELANAFSELNDPLDQKERFMEQVRVREAGGEGGYMDLDYIRALEYGMPPAGGMGVGIDRLTMLFTDAHSIRDTILFPLMRPEKIE